MKQHDEVPEEYGMQSDFGLENMTYTKEEREELDDAFVELNYGYPMFVGVGKMFIEQMVDAKFQNPEINLIRLESLIAGWIYAQPWFANMVDQIPHTDAEIFEHVGDTVLQAATDASAGLNWFPQPEPEEVVDVV